MKGMLLIICLALLTGLQAQYPKYIIQLTDKNNDSFIIADPSKYLSAKALDRRTRYSITIDSFDLPVVPAYITTVLAQGKVQLLSQSKWLNQILIYCTDNSVIAKIQSLPFVRSAKGIGYRTAFVPVNKFKEKVNPITHTNNRQQGAMDVYNYGNAYDQVNIHHGEFLHNKGFTGNGITIAMLDAGFYQYNTVPAFDSIRLNNQVLGVKDFVDYDNSVTEDDIHGMYCLSTIAANLPGSMVGTAPKADFWLLRSENANSEYPIEEHNWVVAAEYADSAGADMISSSLGYNQFDDAAFNHSYADFYKNTTMISKGAAIACNKGMIVTNSAGNEGNNSWKYIIFPADTDSVCSVGAVNTAGQIAAFSSYGYPGRQKPNIVSVGSNTVIASLAGPVTGNGTSFSNPLIAGLIACLWQAFPQFNNWTILDAVYKSADRYANPDNQYGYGIPDMKAAYRLLKHQQNVATYGNDWLFATPNPFSDLINVVLIGQVDGNAVLQLMDPDGNIVATQKIVTEAEEVYTPVFDNLINLPGGSYTLKYTDSLNLRPISLNKNGVLLHDWLQATPVPFTNQLNVYLKAPENGNASLRLIDAHGKTIATRQLNITENRLYNINFNNIAHLARAVYFIRYKGPQQSKTIKVVKE